MGQHDDRAGHGVGDHRFHQVGLLQQAVPVRARLVGQAKAQKIHRYPSLAGQVWNHRPEVERTGRIAMQQEHCWRVARPRPDEHLSDSRRQPAATVTPLPDTR